MRINRTFLRKVVQTVPKWCTRGRADAADGVARVRAADPHEGEGL